MIAERELQLVELVSPDGVAIGSSTVADAHTDPGLLHRAFSVLLFDPQGRILVQQRAAGKTRFPLRWANSCCGHPAPGEAVTVAAGRRLDEELGLRDVELTEAGVYAYVAPDPATGRVEREYDHVLIGQVVAELPVAPDPAEVQDVLWVDGDLLLSDVTTGSPDRYAPWLAGVLTVALRPPADYSAAYLRR
jgi:isopentenyl-diphosphate delta-isomerase